MKKFKVVIIGGGPAGAAAALYFKQANIQTALVDKALFPRDKSCGDGIPLKTFRLLEELGFREEELFSGGFRISGMSVYAPNGIRADFGKASADSATKSGCIPRKYFDNLLFQKAKQQVDAVYEGYKLEQMTKTTAGWQLKLKDTNQGKITEIETELLIGADGAGSYTARQSGLFPVNERFSFEGLRLYYTGKTFSNRVQIFYDRRILPGYVWLFPVAENRANVGIMAPRRNSRKNKVSLRTVFDEILKTNPDVKEALSGAEPDSPVRGALLPLGNAPGKRTGDHLILIGDAAAFINPLTGGGIYFALQSARAAARIGAQALQKGSAARENLNEYERWYRDALSPGFYYADWFKKKFASQRFVNAFIKNASRFKPAATFFMMIYGRPLPKRVFWNPLFWIKILFG